MEYLPVTVDKSHLITIGERLYSESIELIRELVNNAYDADATEVEIKMTPESIEVRDNGTGMDREGLKQYFNIGSPEKVIKTKSPLFHRDRIGQFGIGKFASLSACECFGVYTQKGYFSARVTFDKVEWEKEGDQWNLPLQILPPDQERKDGTTITPLRLTRAFEPEEVVRKIVEGTPLKVSNFTVRLNGMRITPRSLSGHRIPFLEGTDFGPVHGEIIILPSSTASPVELGIEVKVKQVTVKRELFGLDHWGKVVSRIRGEVHADFLLVTTDRSGFIVDSPQYQAFRKVMDKVIREVDDILKRLAGRKEKRKANKALKEALQRVHRALALNPDLSPFGAIPLAGEGEGMGGAGVVPKKLVSEGRKRKPETYILNVTRLITQEISLMKDTKNPRQAFSRQSKLLRDAFIEGPSRLS